MSASAANGTAALRSATVVVTATSLTETLVQREIANQICPGWVEASADAARAVYLSVTGHHPGALPKDRHGEAQLARSYGKKIYFNAPGQMLKGFARSALLSAYFENESAGRAWVGYVTASDAARADHSADVQAVDATTGTGPTATEDGGNDLDRAASRAMEAVASAAHWVGFAVELARIVERLGDGEEIVSTYTPKATTESKSVTPKAAATLAQFLANTARG